MSRTKVRIILILIAFILIMAAALSGILTYWAGAEAVPTSTPATGEAGRIPVGTWQPQALAVPSLQELFAIG